jgi:hypothetical protein
MATATKTNRKPAGFGLRAESVQEMPDKLPASSTGDKELPVSLFHKD